MSRLSHEAPRSELTKGGPFRAPPITTGEVVVARLKLLTLSASGGGRAHAVRHAADGLVEGEELAASHIFPTPLQKR